MANTTAEQKVPSFSFSSSAEDDWCLLAPEDCRPLTSVPSDVLRIIGAYLSNVNRLCRTCSYFWSIFHTEYTFHFPTWHWVEGYLNSHKFRMPNLKVALGSRTEPLPPLQMDTLIVRPTSSAERYSSPSCLLRELLKDDACSHLKTLRLADWEDESDDCLRDILEHTHNLEVLEIRPGLGRNYKQLVLAAVLPIPATVRILRLHNVGHPALFQFCKLLKDHKKFPNLESIGLSHCYPNMHIQTPQHEYSPPGGIDGGHAQDPPVLVAAVSLGFNFVFTGGIAAGFELLRLPTHICVNHHRNWSLPLSMLRQGDVNFSHVSSLEIVYDQKDTKSDPVMLDELPKDTLLRLSVEFQFLENKFHDDAEFPSSLQEFALHLTGGSQFDVLSMALVLESVCERCPDLQRVEIWALQNKNWEEPTKVVKCLGQVWPPPTDVTFPLVVMVGTEVWESSNLAGCEDGNLQFKLVSR